MLNRIFILLFLVSGCDCNYHLKRAYKKCGKSAVVDTIHVMDTIITKGVRKDTSFHYYTKDTVYLKDGKLLVKYFYHDSTVYLQGNCLPDTVVKEIKVPVKVDIPRPEIWGQIKWPITIILIVLLLCILWLIFRKR